MQENNEFKVNHDTFNYSALSDDFITGVAMAINVWSNTSNEEAFIALSPEYYAYIDVPDIQKIASAKKFIAQLKKTNTQKYQQLIKQIADWTKKQEEQTVDYLMNGNYAIKQNYKSVEDLPSDSYNFLKSIEIDKLKRTKINPQSYQRIVYQARDWMLATEYLVFLDNSNESKEEKFKKAKKKLDDLSYNYDRNYEAEITCEAHFWASNKIKAIAIKDKQQATEFMAESDYYKTNASTDDKLKDAKNVIEKYEKEDLEKYQDLMEKTRHWATQQTLDQYAISSYIADCLTSYQEVEAAEILKKKKDKHGNSFFLNTEAAKNEIENFKKTDLTKYRQIIAEARTLFGPDTWDQLAKEASKNLKAWVAEYVKIGTEQAKKRGKDDLALINDAFAQAEIMERGLARFMVERGTARTPGKLIGDSKMHASNEKEARKIIREYKLTKPEVYKDLIKRAHWEEDYNRPWNDYRNECNTPFQPEGLGTTVNEEKFAALSMDMCEGPLNVAMQSAFDGHIVKGELSAAKEQLVWSYLINCVSYKPDAISIINFLDQVKNCFQPIIETNDKKTITRLVNSRGRKNVASYRGDAWKVGTCQITTTFIKKDKSLREKNSPQYDSGKEMKQVHYTK